MTLDAAFLRTWLLALASLIVVLVAPTALAQSAPSLRAAALPSDVEVGQVFAFRMTAMVAVSDRAPERPSVALPAGFVIRGGPHVMPQTQVSITGAGMQQSTGIEVTWQVEARAPGRHTIGPGSVTWQGKRFETGRVRVTVHPAGTLPRRQDPFDLFDIFGLPKMPGLPGFPDLTEPALPPADPALAMAAPSDRVVFLRAMADKQDIVLGEQLTLSVYEYVQGATPRQVEAREPAASDFLQRPLLAPDDEPGVRYAEVGSESWRVRLIRKIALFPLKTGSLVIGPMELKYQAAGLRGPAIRRSNPLRVRVSDAPEAGRPVGFRPGDVGQFSLSAEVAPTTVIQGGAVAVTVRLEGVGNFPMTLDVPRRKGVDWLDPTTREQFDVSKDDRIRGVRTFMYVVRMSDAGAVDLGTVELPFYDPWRRTYETARANLGVVNVTPSAEPATSTQEAPDRFETVAPARSQLVPAPLPHRPLSDSPLFWLSLVVGPAGVLVFGATASGVRSARDRLTTWRSSLGRHSSRALHEARRAASGGSKRDAAAAAERALHIGLEAATGLKTRGVLRDELAGELEQRGVSPAHAALAVDVLTRCEQLRFDPDADTDVAARLVDDLGALLGELPRPRGKAGAAR